MGGQGGSRFWWQLGDYLPRRGEVGVGRHSISNDTITPHRLLSRTGLFGSGLCLATAGGGGKGRGFGVVKKYSHMGSDTCIHLAMSCKFDKCICSMSMIRTQSENLSCITLILH